MYSDLNFKMFAFNVTTPNVLPLELLTKVLSYEGEHEIVNGELIRKVRKIAKDDRRFNIVEQIQRSYLDFEWGSYDDKCNAYVLHVGLYIKKEGDNKTLYDLRKKIEIDKNGVRNIVFDIYLLMEGCGWDGDDETIEMHTILNDQLI